jgi:hypothetical protein
MAQTSRSRSLVENLNSRLRTGFTLRRHLGGAYLSLLQFFLNHRRFMRSQRAARNGKSPRELMTGRAIRTGSPCSAWDRFSHSEPDAGRLAPPEQDIVPTKLRPSQAGGFRAPV